MLWEYIFLYFLPLKGIPAPLCDTDIGKRARIRICKSAFSHCNPACGEVSFTDTCHAWGVTEDVILECGKRYRRHNHARIADSVFVSRLLTTPTVGILRVPLIYIFLWYLIKKTGTTFRHALLEFCRIRLSFGFRQYGSIPIGSSAFKSSHRWIVDIATTAMTGNHMVLVSFVNLQMS